MSELPFRRGKQRVLAAACGVAMIAAGCTELRGRRRIREGNRLYRDGQYAAALQQYRMAETLTPQLPLLWLNEGLTCRQLMVPGGKSAENDKAVQCALTAFERLRRVAPDDPRAEQLHVQTLFDADRFDTLTARYREQLNRQPQDVAAVNGLIQVTTRANRPEEALTWYQRKAALLPNDAEAHYAVGVFVWQQLYQRGGGPEKASFDPRPDPGDTLPSASSRRGRASTKSRKLPPPFAVGDLTGSQRVALADVGSNYLQRALALRPNYQEAIVYLNLVHRQKALAYFDEPDRWQSAIDAAEKWRRLASAPARPFDGAAGKGGARPAP